MVAPQERADEYEAFYRGFDSPLMRQLRLEAYGEDIGQHSWVSAAELREDALRLRLRPESRLLDLGSGPCGPLTFLIAESGCTGVGLELSPSAIEVGSKRAAEMGIGDRFTAKVADLNDPLPPNLGPFDSALAIDVVLHVRDRQALCSQVASVLSPGGRFLLTDAGVLTGAASNEELRRRSVHGYTQFVPTGWNERVLEATNFRILETEDRTSSVVRNAQGRLAAMHAHREELEGLSGVSSYSAQVVYLSSAVELASRGAVSRIMYLAELQSPAAG